MGSGTIIRIIIGFIILLCPPITVYCTGDDTFWALLGLYLLIPCLIIFENLCDCEDCIMSNYCSKQKKFNFIKSIMKFIGYDYVKIDAIMFPRNYNCENNYFDIYKYIKKEYQK